MCIWIDLNNTSNSSNIINDSNNNSNNNNDNDNDDNNNDSGNSDTNIVLRSLPDAVGSSESRANKPMTTRSQIK